MSVVLLAAAVAGCSTLKLAYSQAPEAAYWWVTDYIDFKDEQKPAVKAALSRIHETHRRTQLPGYASTLQSLQRQAGGDITPAQACAVFSEVESKAHALAQLVDGAAPALALLVTTLDADQLARMERRFTKANAAYRDEYVLPTREARHERRFKQSIKRAEMFYGSLDAAQVELVRRRISQSTYDPAIAYAERVRRQQDVLATLRELMANRSARGESLEPIRTAFKGLIRRSVTSPEEGYRRHDEASRRQGCQTWAELHNSTSPQQRASAVEKLRSYEADLSQMQAF